MTESLFKKYMVDAFLGHSVVIMVNVIDDRYKNVFYVFKKFCHIFDVFLSFNVVLLL